MAKHMDQEASSPSAPKAAVIVVNQKQGPGIVVRFLWFLFVGWWLGQVAIVAAWFLNIFIVTLPLGLYILNRLPQIFTLRPASQEVQTTISETGDTVVQMADIPQRSFKWRAIYFVCVGWWASLFWLELAWLMAVIASLTIVLIPIIWPLAFLMFSKSAAITTLRRT